MARKTAKKQAEAPKVDIGAEIFASLRELEKLKGIPVDYMVERLKQALTNAYRKDREDRRDVPADNVVVDLSEHGLSMHIVKTAVEEVEDTALSKNKLSRYPVIAPKAMPRTMETGILIKSIKFA